MVKKTFLIFLSAEIMVFLLGFAIKNFQPEVSHNVSVDKFPLEKEDWVGVRDNLVPEMVEMLNPTVIFSAGYTNKKGISTHLFFDYFTGQSNPGGPHSPRNCVPGSGWLITGQTDHEIVVNNRSIEVGRFYIRRGEVSNVMDFWYVTRYGETDNDYLFKFYSMISSLTFRPNDIAFIRVIGPSGEEGLQAMEEFETLFVEEIYEYLDYEL